MILKIITKQEAKAAGLKRFFTGEACRNGHIAERHIYGGNPCCTCAMDRRNGNKEAIAAATKAWRVDNPEKSKASSDKWHAANPERTIATRKAYVAENKDAIAEKKKIYRAANPDKVREDKRLYRERNPEKVSLQLKSWRKRNPEKADAIQKACRAKNPELYKKLSLEAMHRRYLHVKKATPKWADKNAIKQLHEEASVLGLAIDHIIPYMGEIVCGLNVENNIQFLTHSENSLKGNSFNPEDHETIFERAE